MTILTAGGVNSVNTRVHYFLSFLGFFARTAEEITYFIIEIDRVGGFLQSHRSDFGTVFFFFAKICVFVAQGPNSHILMTGGFE